MDKLCVCGVKGKYNFYKLDKIMSIIKLKENFVFIIVYIVFMDYKI